MERLVVLNCHFAKSVLVLFQTCQGASMRAGPTCQTRHSTLRIVRQNVAALQTESRPFVSPQPAGRGFSSEVRTASMLNFYYDKTCFASTRSYEIEPNQFKLGGMQSKTKRMPAAFTMKFSLFYFLPFCCFGDISLNY